MIRKLINCIRIAARRQHGQTFVEYTLLLVGVSLALLAAFGPLGDVMTGLLEAIGNAIP